MPRPAPVTTTTRPSQIPLHAESRTHSIFPRQTLFRFPGPVAISFRPVRRPTLLLATVLVTGALVVPTNTARAQTSPDTTTPVTTAPPTATTAHSPVDHDRAEPGRGNLHGAEGAGCGRLGLLQRPVEGAHPPPAGVPAAVPQRARRHHRRHDPADARTMASNNPAAMVLALGNPDMALVDEPNPPDVYADAQRILNRTATVPCVVWVNLKQRGVNGLLQPELGVGGDRVQRVVGRRSLGRRWPLFPKPPRPQLERRHGRSPRLVQGRRSAPQQHRPDRLREQDRPHAEPAVPALTGAD